MPPPEIGKVVLEIWCYLPKVYTVGVQSVIQEIYSKNCQKSPFSRDILITKSPNPPAFLRICFLFGPNAQNFGDRLLNFPFPMEIIPQISMIFFELFRVLYRTFGSRMLFRTRLGISPIVLQDLWGTRVTRQPVCLGSQVVGRSAEDPSTEKKMKVESMAD